MATVRTDPDFEMESRVSFGAMLAFSTSRNTRQFDSSPTDQRVLMLRIEDRRADELIWVDSWTEMLREQAEN